MGLGVDPLSPSQVQEVPALTPDAGVNDTLAALGIGALLTLLLGGVVLGLAAPFALGALGGAIAAPGGEKKQAAKQGAVYGGLIGIGTNIALSLVSTVIRASSGSRTAYIGGAGLVPLAVGLYIGYKKREES